jgi:hypothetical protein
MTTTEVIQNIPENLFDAQGNTPKTMLLVRGDTVATLPQGYLAREGDQVYEYSKFNGTINLMPVAISAFGREFTTAEEWLIAQGYGPMQLVALLDAERKLTATNQESPKLGAVRGWVDALTQTFLQSQEPRNDWPSPPHRFDEALLEAGQILSP